MVAEIEVPGASVSIIARRHDINANLLFKWRKEIEVEDRAGGAGKVSEFLPIGIVGQSANGGSALVSGTDCPLDPGLPGSSERLEDRTGLMEIELAGGVTVRADATVDERALGRVLAALRHRR